jgi:phosphatidylethanolamine N-methyltransferase
MFKTVLDPKLRKTTLDLITIGTLVLQCYLFFILGRNPTFRAIFFFVLFALWRSAYNIGLGILLKKQSEERWLVNWLAKSGLLNGREGGKGFLAHWAVWIRGQLEQKMGPDYDFDVSMGKRAIIIHY